MPMPSVQDMQANIVVNPTQSQMFRQTFYDYQIYPTAGQAQLNFFQQPIGSGLATALGAVVGSAKTDADTNMMAGGQFPSGMMYTIESIEADFIPGSSATASTFTIETISKFAAANAAAVAALANDINTIYNSGVLSFEVLGVPILTESPLKKFPPKANLTVQSALATTSATAGEVSVTYAKADGRPYYMEPKATMQPTMTFVIRIRWPGVVATPSGFNGRIGVILDGYLMRASV